MEINYIPNSVAKHMPKSPAQAMVFRDAPLFTHSVAKRAESLKGDKDIEARRERCGK